MNVSRCCRSFLAAVIITFSMYMINKRSAKKPELRSLLLPALWFLFLVVFVVVCGVAIFLGLFAVIARDGQLSQSQFLLMVWADALLLMIALFICVGLNQDSASGLGQWTRRSCLAILALVCLLAMGVSVGVYLNPETIENKVQDNSISISEGGVSGGRDYVEGVRFRSQILLEESNKERRKAGVNSLELSTVLSTSARKKCQDMTKLDYWAHTSPDGREPWSFITDEGYTYLSAGENLAYGFSNESDIVRGWMNSPTHKDNLLNAEFTEVGFGECEAQNYQGSGRQYIVVQHLAVPKR